MSLSDALLSAYPFIATVHAIIGAVALASFWTAAFASKGSGLHRRVGQVYLLAMAGIVITGLLLALGKWLQGQPVAAAFLGYLLVITAAAVWTAWRAVRDRNDPWRYTGPVFVALGALAVLSGSGILWLGLQVGSPLLIGFSTVGLFAGGGMLHKRLHRARLAQRPLWWRTEHYTAMLGNAVATHIAFLVIGLPKLFPALGTGGLYYLAWFGPLGVALLAKAWLDRRYRLPPRPQPRNGRTSEHRERRDARTRASGASADHTSPSLSQPSPVPRLNTTSPSSTVPAGTESRCASAA